ncbi:vWA domain-containing protein [uncultured Pseudodesulfovibrio sp.]|uniref:vWA domain-containing protein n=1 Tax=uncultured Pseudodesulfovibrio sp. TaxID=2035858 RepID=UPI0029C63E38|nr:vWA domain-containing protein [uncultured Pseudodesulfovibrio sp.]
MKSVLAVFVLLAMLTTGGVAQAAMYADIAFMVDQTGSMDGEFNWIGNSLDDLGTAVGNAGITARYGIAGYESLAGSDDPRNVWKDLPSTQQEVVDIASAITSLDTYGATENSFNAAMWAVNNFSWSGGDYAKILILITDEDVDDYQQATETGLGQLMAQNNVLLNVITYQGYFTQWDEAVYSTNDGYLGLFDLSYLQTDPDAFTADFIAAKTAEIQDYDPSAVPEPTTVLLMGLGLLGLVGLRRKLSA